MKQRKRRKIYKKKNPYRIDADVSLLITMQFFLLLFFPHKMGVHKQRKKKTTFFVWMSVSSFSFEKKKNSGECITVRRLLWTGIKAHTLQSQNQIRWISMICKWLLSSWLHRNSFCVRMQNHFFLLLTLQRNRNNSFVFFFHFFFLFNSEEVQQWKFT